MTLIAYGEIRFLNGEASLFARFAQADGRTFDLPLSEDQFTVLLAGLGTPTSAAPPQPVKRASATQEDDEEDVGDSRPFSVAFSSDEDDDL